MIITNALAIKILIAMLSCYLIGSFQPSYLLGRLIYKKDIRDYGSGNAGATNALRVFGKKFGLTCLLIDAGKGALAIMAVKFVFRDYMPEPSLAVGFQLFCGVICVLGHNHPFYMNFKGGKGVASTIGIILTIDPRVFFYAGIPALLILFFGRIMSVASLSMQTFAFIYFAVTYHGTPFYPSLMLVAVAYPIISFWRHRENLKRLKNGEEKKLWGKGSGKKKEEEHNKE